MIVAQDLRQSGNWPVFIKESNVILFHYNNIKDKSYEGMLYISEYLYDSIVSREDVHE